MYKSEKRLEELFKAYVSANGGWCVKLIAASITGFPDRTVLCRGGGIYFVELKRPDGRGVVSKRQLIVHEALTRMGFEVLVTESLKEATEFHDAFIARTARVPERRD